MGLLDWPDGLRTLRRRLSGRDRAEAQRYVDGLQAAWEAEMVARLPDRGYVYEPEGRVWYPHGDACVWPRGPVPYGVNARDLPLRRAPSTIIREYATRDTA